MTLTFSLILAFAAPSQRASATTLSVKPSFTIGALAFPLQSFTDADGELVVVCDEHALTATQSGIELISYGDRRWFLGLSYRQDRRVGLSDTILGGESEVRDLVDRSLPPLLDGYILRNTTGDIDGDGTNDLIVRNLEDADFYVVLMGSAGPRVVPLLAPPLNPWESLHYNVMPDLDGDGRAEVLYITAYDDDSTALLVHNGGSDGYDASSRASVVVDGGVVRAIAIQADIDAELELLVLVVDVTEYDYSNWWDAEVIDPRFVIVDDVHTATPVVLSTPGKWSTWMTDIFDVVEDSLASLGDIDGDGLDDVQLVGSRDDAPKDVHIVTSRSGYDLGSAIALGMAGGVTERPSSYVVDVDQDGHVDIVAKDGGSGAGDAIIQIWFGPLVEDVPVVHTADTGGGGTGDTGLAVEDTGSSGSPTPTETGSGSDSAAPGAPAEAARPCGCDSGAGGGAAGLLGLLVTAVGQRRRRGGAGATGVAVTRGST